MADTGENQNSVPQGMDLRELPAQATSAAQKIIENQMAEFVATIGNEVAPPIETPGMDLPDLPPSKQ